MATTKASGGSPLPVVCTLQRCGRFTFPVTAGPGFVCPSGEAACPVLHPPPAPRFWTRGRVILCVLVCVSAAAWWGAASWLAARAERLRPRILAARQTPYLPEGGRWEAALEVSGAEPLRIQWYRGLTGDTRAPLEGATGAALALQAVKPGAGYWAEARNEYGAARSETLTPEPKHVILADYPRQITEALAFSREILEQSHAIRVFREQLETPFEPLRAEEVRSWTAALGKAREKRDDGCRNLLGKFEDLKKLDPNEIIKTIDRWETGFEGVEASRRRVSLAFLRKHWLHVSSGGGLPPADLATDAETLAVNF